MPHNPSLTYFDQLYGASADPYGLRTRWYEQRKRALTLAALPHPRYRSAYEPGCGAGELTAALATRCETLLSSDFSEKGLAAARARNGGRANVQLAVHDLPREWPLAQTPFDLIVISELGYFLQADAMQQLAADCAASLDVDGTLVACHWRPSFSQRTLTTEAVHQTLEQALSSAGAHTTLRHEEADFLLQVWCRDARSVAQRGGIR